MSKTSKMSKKTREAKRHKALCFGRKTNSLGRKMSIMSKMSKACPSQRRCAIRVWTIWTQKDAKKHIYSNSN